MVIVVLLDHYVVLYRKITYWLIEIDKEYRANMFDLAWSINKIKYDTSLRYSFFLIKPAMPPHVGGGGTF